MLDNIHNKHQIFMWARGLAVNARVKWESRKLKKRFEKTCECGTVYKGLRKYCSTKCERKYSG